MSKFLQRVLVCLTVAVMPFVANAQQLPDPGFENWNGEKFDGNIQPKYWNGSNVEQVGFKFNFITRETGHTGYCAKVEDKEVGAMGITEVGPGYFALGKPWAYLPSITAINQATAGTEGGISFTYRPDTISVWIKRTGSAWNNEDFHVLFYTWKGTAQGTSYKGKNGNCTSTNRTNEESDIRIALDGNECQTTTVGQQIAEGWLRDRKQYNDWTNVRVPIYYLNNDVPQMCNVIFSAGNYPNFRANSGLNEGNAIYVDDVELIYSSKIDHLFIGGKEWKGFNPNSTEEQTYSVGRTTEVPEVYGMRGTGSLTNTKGTKVDFPGRKLSGNEITISYGQVDGTPTVITVRAEDGSSTMTYKIKMVQEPSDNPRLNTIMVNGESIKGYNAYVGTYNVALPYGTTAAPEVTFTYAEDGQTAVVTQASSPTGTATIVVTAPDNKTKMTYTINFSVALLSDNTLKDIKVNGESLPSFNPTLSSYKVELPLGTETMPTVEAVSAYPAGAQTITYNAPDKIDGGQYQISVTTPGNQNPRVYKLNFKITASSNSKLRDLQMGGYIIAFNPDNTTYYVDLPMGTTALPEITYVAGDKEQTITVEEGGLNGTTKITVTAGNGTNTTVYKIVCSTKKSDVSYLNDILLDGVSLPGFDPFTYRYTVDLGLGATTIPTITTVPGDQYQPEPRIVLGAINATTRIFVTADDGSTSLYEIVFTVKLSSVSTLSMIKIGGVNLEGFDPDITEYNVNLPQGTKELPTIEAVKGDPYQSEPVIREGGIDGDTKITVRAQDGSTTVYILHVSVTQSSKTTLDAVYFDGHKFLGFDPAIREYDSTLTEGVTKVPVLTYDYDESQQSVVMMQEGSTYTVLVIAESGASDTYVFRFHVQKSENAKLKMIYLDGDSLEGFDPEINNYSVVLTKATCPIITVDKDPTQQVTITTPVSTGEALIRVQPESGAPMDYTITFESSLQPLLSTIKADGVEIEGFAEDKFDGYTVTYSGAMPVITFEVKHEGTKASLVTNAAGARIYTEIAGTKKEYVIAFTKLASSDATLTSIAANDSIFADFAKDKLNYNYILPTSQEFPVITYTASNPEKQHIVAGLISQYDYAITVIAENGAKNEYTIHYVSNASTNTTPAEVKIGDEIIAFGENDTIEKTITKGSDLPELTYTAQDNQTVISAQTGALEQQMIVIAEDGSSTKQVIKYNEDNVITAQLNDLHILNGEKWEQVAGFKKDSFVYNVTLPRGTKNAPCVWAVAGQPGQTITITYGNADGQTNVHVVASDNSFADYNINFTVAKSNNCKLGDLQLNTDEDVELQPAFHADSLNYVVVMPFGATACPVLEFEKARDENNVEIAEQRIDMISRPLGDTTKIIVTAENGDSRTYNIYFKETFAEEANRLVSIYIPEIENNLSLKDKTKRNFDVTLPYGCRSLTVEYEKNFPEQTVFVQPGGINNPTILTVKSNRPGEADEVYTINPIKTTQNPAILTGITVDGEALPGFDPNRFTYILNRTATTTPKVKVTKNSGVEYDVETDLYKWIATVEKDGFVNTYKIFFHYPNDVIPNNNFTSWTKTSSANSDKPSSWNAPGDYIDTYLWTAKASDVIKKESNTVVHLVTAYWAALAGPIPSVLNLGTMTAKFAVAGGTTVTPSGFIGFHNTPDKAIVNYKYTSKAGNGALFRFKFVDIDGEEHLFDHTQTSTKSSYANYNVPLTTDGMAVAGLDIIIDATGQYPTASSSADLYVDSIAFTYNSTPKDAKVNGIDAVLNDKKFTVTLTDPEDVNIRSYEFNGEVSDQAQKLTWGAWSTSGNPRVRTATIINYAEDGTSTTGYTLEVKRPLCSKDYLSNLLIDGAQISGFAANTLNYEITLQPKQQLPDIYPVPASSLQTITTNYDASSKKMTITVTSETGSVKTYTIQFNVNLSADATLAGIAAGKQALDVTQHEFTLEGKNMPIITFTKQSDLQTVSLINGVITVTAEDGVHTGIYTIECKETIPPSDNQLATITRELERIKDFDAGTFDYNATYSDNVGFERKGLQEADAIVETLTDAYMSIAVNGISTYTITYPTEASDDADLADILYNGVSYDQFSPQQVDYEEETDDPVDVKFILKEKVQKLELDMIRTRGALYTKVTAKVTAESGREKTYTFIIKPESSVINTLACIKVAGDTLEDFFPERTNYVYNIPVATPKLAEPNIPNVEYVLGQESETVEIIPATKIGEYTQLIVTPENGDITKQKTYKIQMVAEPSRNAELKNIIVNSEPVKNFKPSRTYYSMQVVGDQVKIDYSLGDPFQTVEVSETTDAEGTIIKTLKVTAQDGVTVREYEIEIWKAVKSNNANLEDILFNNAPMSAYKEGLYFSEKNYNYVIPVLSTDTLPDISAKLQEDAQRIEITSVDGTEGIVKTIIVTAEDGTTKNEYTLLFKRTKSDNTKLETIRINGVALANFADTIHEYVYPLEVGVRKLPLVTPMKGEPVQTVSQTQDSLTTIITVIAENGAKGEYKVRFEYTLSDIDVLKSLSIIGEQNDIDGFRPDSFRYSYILPMGVREAYELTYEKGYKDQKVETSVVKEGLHTIYHFTVEAENGSKNFYTVTYEMQRSNVDTLISITLGGKPMVEFEPRTNDYTVVLPHGTKSNPTVEVDSTLYGDPYQKVEIDSTKNYTKVAVIAEDQHQRVYTILFEIARSNNADLAGIAIDGTLLSDFDEDKLNYTVALPYDATSLPNVTYSPVEDEQIIKVSKDGATVYIEVLAEDRVTKKTYVVNFVRALSSEAHINMIYLDEKPIEGFMRDIYEYPVVLPYGTEELPQVSYLLADTTAKVDTIWFGDILTLRVTSMDETELEYVINFTRALSPVSWLDGIIIKGEPLENFHQDTLVYKITYPIGTPTSEFLTADDITYIKADTAETVIVNMQGDDITLVVTAADGENSTAYVIRQFVALRSNSLLKAIMIDGKMLPHFADSVFTYEYILAEGTMIPEIVAEPQDSAATWDLTKGDIGKETIVYGIAEDGSETQYKILFRYSTINEGLDATFNDVLVKVVGSQLFVATIRKNVSFALYDQSGRLVYYNSVPVADPNASDIYYDPQSKEVLNDVTDADSGLFIDINQGQIYFYSFYVGDKQKIKSGKLIAVP
ncbi:MAG: hypothetical protein J6T80_00755 [Paludibacteraceae bacterium]|nr:hypothetical protein [Paludibacteraceae bacterium]